MDEIVKKFSKESSEDEKKHASEIVKTVFTSSSCLNGSFLDPYVFGHNVYLIEDFTLKIVYSVDF